MIWLLKGTDQRMSSYTRLSFTNRKCALTISGHFIQFSRQIIGVVQPIQLFWRVFFLFSFLFLFQSSNTSTYAFVFFAYKLISITRKKFFLNLDFEWHFLFLFNDNPLFIIHAKYVSCNDYNINNVLVMLKIWISTCPIT